MKKLHRIEIGNKILEELYNNNADLPDDKITDLFYDFLTNAKNLADFFTQSICHDYEIEPQELEIYKQDMILEVLAAGYEFLNYTKTFDEFPELEKEILADLNSLTFSVKNLVDYFRNPLSIEKAKKILLDYFIYMTQDADFVDDCREYNLEEITYFYDNIIRAIKYIEVSDVLVLINEEVFQKYHPDVEEEEEEKEIEEYDEEELEDIVIESVVAQMEFEEEHQNLEEEYQEVYDKILDYLDRYFVHDKSLMDDFIGFFMSFVYAFLVKVYEERQLTLEDEEMLAMFISNNVTFEYVVEMFHSSKEFVCYSVELFSQEYYGCYGDIYSIRENYTSPFDNRRFKLLDPFYSNPNSELNIVYFGNPIVSFMDKILCKIKAKYPETYVEEIYKLLCDPNYDCSLFEELGLEPERILFYQNRMIRFLSRKYVEECSLKQLADFSLEELFIYQGLMFSDSIDNNILSIMEKGFPYIIPSYFSLKEKGVIYEKGVLRQLKEKNVLEKLVMIDPSCTTDDIYLKSLKQSSFYSILEVNGIRTTIQYLKHLELSKAKENLKELIMSNYYYAKSGIFIDKISSSIVSLLEETPESLDNYLIDLLYSEKKLPLLEELLQRYLDQEKKAEYSLSYQEKLEDSPKIKQILYPNGTLENR